ncbi:MAG: hypothetical protein HXS44_04965 [Theionarchaea archaeon]|nr:hypothetical protein [Theionarchaea archaeon]
MKRLMIRLTPEQEAGIREAFGFDQERACNILQFELDDAEIENIREGDVSRPLPPYLIVPPADGGFEGAVSFF